MSREDSERADPQRAESVSKKNLQDTVAERLADLERTVAQASNKSDEQKAQETEGDRDKARRAQKELELGRELTRDGVNDASGEHADKLREWYSRTRELIADRPDASGSAPPQG